MPEMGFIDSIKYFITQLVFSFLTILLTAVIVYVGIQAVATPALLARELKEAA